MRYTSRRPLQHVHMCDGHTVESSLFIKALVCPAELSVVNVDDAFQSEKQAPRSSQQGLHVVVSE